MLTAEEARLLKTRPVNQVTMVLDLIETAIRRAATQGRVTEVDVTALVPQPHSKLWMDREGPNAPNEFIAELSEKLMLAGYEVASRAASAGSPGYIKVRW